MEFGGAQCHWDSADLRICSGVFALYRFYLSCFKIPRALGIQRKVTKDKRAKVPRINTKSWLGRNHLYVQLGWFSPGLNARLLGINHDCCLLLRWLLITLAAAITVGFLYSGKSWCNYFCVMTPVQKSTVNPGLCWLNRPTLVIAKLPSS
ncbi:MAG: hypothetical protein ACUVRV_05535 [Cyanobacteriota bacterium]